MIAPTLKAADVKVGDPLPRLEKRFSQVDLVAYGAATWDWHRLHYDLDYARSKNLPGTLVDGQAFGAVFARVAQDWAGPRAFITRLSFKMRSMAFAGDTLVAAGEVTAVRAVPGGHVVTLAQRLMNGERLAADAVTEVRLPET
jgi:acyl dehydratase